MIAGAGGRGYRGPNATTLPAVSRRTVGVVDNRAEIREFLTTRRAKITHRTGLTDAEFARIEAQLAKVEIYGNRTDEDIAKLRHLD